MEDGITVSLDDGFEASSELALPRTSSTRSSPCRSSVLAREPRACSQSITVARVLAPPRALALAMRDSSSGRPGCAGAPGCPTVDRVKRSRLRPGELPSAYRWYDRRVGTIDLVALALDSMTGVRARPALVEPPPWILAAALPTQLPNASLSTLAELSGRACRAWVDAGRPGLDVTTTTSTRVPEPPR